MYFVCGTKWGRVSEVYKAKCTGSNSGNSWLLSAQVCNLHFYLSGIDNVCGKKDKSRLSSRCIRMTHMWVISRRHPELLGSVAP